MLGRIDLGWDGSTLVPSTPLLSPATSATSLSSLSLLPWPLPALDDSSAATHAPRRPGHLQADQGVRTGPASQDHRIRLRHEEQHRALLREGAAGAGGSGIAHYIQFHRVGWNYRLRSR